MSNIFVKENGNIEIIQASQPSLLIRDIKHDYCVNSPNKDITVTLKCNYIYNGWWK